MAFKKRVLLVSLCFVMVIGVILVVGILPNLPLGMLPNSSAGISPQIVQIEITPTSIWSGLLEQMPYPHTTPLPDSAVTNIDGTYAKVDSSLPQWWACRRCADYRPAGGIWKLQFDRGVMRIYYDVTGWRSIASYTVSGDLLYLFNDPYCPQAVGEFTWRSEDRNLEFAVIDDPCSLGLRGKNLGMQPWGYCGPPNESTKASDSRDLPSGCEQNPIPQITGVLPDLSVSVVVHSGYTRDFARQPDVYAVANNEGNSPPEGILITHSDASVAYGLNRVLWGEGDWVQASTDLPFDTLGVQVYGDHTIGWARVIFDGEEVWRGNTAAIWSDKGRHGGYIEVSGFDPGSHTIRIESLGFDYRPVTVAYFGFGYQGGVKRERK